MFTGYSKIMNRDPLTLSSRMIQSQPQITGKLENVIKIKENRTIRESSLIADSLSANYCYQCLSYFILVKTSISLKSSCSWSPLWFRRNYVPRYERVKEWLQNADKVQVQRPMK